MHVIMEPFISIIVDRDKIAVYFIHKIISKTQIIHYIDKSFATNLFIKIFEIYGLICYRVDNRDFEIMF